MKQLANTVVMVRPANFEYNPETAENNAFQSKAEKSHIESIKHSAIHEFDNMVSVLNSKGVETIILQDEERPVKPDAIFPNNWISIHEGGIIITYPMWAKSRRKERSEELIERISKYLNSDRRYSFEQFEDSNMFLEGTGSMVLDRVNKIVYACLSPRTDIRILDKFCELMGYQPIVFHAKDRKGVPMYHTNVMMVLGEGFVIVCLECIPDPNEVLKLRTHFKNTGKEIIEISIEQVESYAGNMLEVASSDGETYLVMSKSAFEVLRPAQIASIERHTSLLPIPIPTIEKYGGGSVRCMMAEVFA